MDEAELRAWLAPTSVERVGYGSSRATYLVTMPHGEDVVARVDTGAGPTAGTELSLAREATVYAALAGTKVRIPRLHEVRDDGAAIVVERALGTHETAGLGEAARQVVYDDYIDALVELHTVDATTLELPGLRHPTGGATAALEELACWEGILDARTTRPWPLARFAIGVLRRLAPAQGSRPTVLCHGDVGPGNFLHDGARVTALLDWEFAHLGDPMDDLAWWVFRGHDVTGGCGDLASQLARWSAKTRVDIDAPAIAYYRALVMVRWLVSVAAVIERGGSDLDRSVHFALVPILAVQLPRALAELCGVELEPASELGEGTPGPAADAIRALGEDLAAVIAPAVTEPEAVRRIAGAQLLLTHLAAADRLAVAVAQAEADDVAARHGGADGADEATTLRYFWRAGHRQVALWPLVQFMASKPLTAIPA